MVDKEMSETARDVGQWMIDSPSGRAFTIAFTRWATQTSSDRENTLEMLESIHAQVPNEIADGGMKKSLGLLVEFVRAAHNFRSVADDPGAYCGCPGCLARKAMAH